MKTEISRISFDEWKHYLGVYQQMGRQQLDADANEQSEILLRLQQRQGADSICKGSQNFGFRVGDRVLVDVLDDAEEWAAEVNPGDPAVTPFVDFFEHRAGQGSLNTTGATTLVRSLGDPFDWTGIVEVRFLAKAVAVPDLLLGSGGNRALVTPVEVAQFDDWQVFVADLTAPPAGIDLSAINEYGFGNLVPAETFAFDLLEVDLPVWSRFAPWVHWVSLDAQPLGAPPAVAKEDDDRRWMNQTSLRVENAASVLYTQPAPRDLSHVRRLRFAAMPITPAASVTVRLFDDNGNQDDFGPFNLALADVWNEVEFDLNLVNADPTSITQAEWRALDAQGYFFSPLLKSADPADDLVIMGGDGSAHGAGRLYVDGLSAIKEVTDTYFTQADLPQADSTSFDPLADDTHRVDYAVLQSFERPMTFIEDPEIREIGLEGPDTTTRMKLVSQVRILAGQAVALADDPVAPDADFEALPKIGSGTLTTKDSPAAALDPCADPCEPIVDGTFVGDSNQLYRVEIHRCGNIGDPADPGTALFKWSNENAAIASPITLNAEAGVFSVIVEQPERFAIGDQIELSDDLVELMTGPYEDRATHRCHERGALRIVTGINLNDRRVSWEDAAGDPADHGPLPFDLHLPYHPKIRRWSGVAPVVAGDIILADAVVIEFGGQDMIPGDFWVFATRVINRSVERLIEAPAFGTEYRYCKLAKLYRRREAGIDSLDAVDCRPTFRPLSKIKAADVAYDAEQWFPKKIGWEKVENVQEAIDALCELRDDGDLKHHNKHLHGFGVVCGLKVICHPSRIRVVVRPGYALDCEGCDIVLERPLTVDLLKESEKFLDNNGDGTVCLSIERSVAGPVVKVHPNVPQTFWEKILEGSLLKDFYEECILNLFQWAQTHLLPPFVTTGLPVPQTQKNFVTLVHLLAQFINPTSGAYVYLSFEEHELLRKMYEELKALIKSETFCAMFDNVTPFPPYPWQTPPPQTTTMFGLMNIHPWIKAHPNQKLLYTFGGNQCIHVFDPTTGEQIEELAFPGGTNLIVHDIAFAEDDGFFAVGTIDDKDSFFVRATLNADLTHTFGPTTTVCDIVFTALATTPERPGNLLAVGRGEGLYDFANPAAIPKQPNVTVGFKACGRLAMSTDQKQMALMEFAGASHTTYDRVRVLDMSNLAQIGASIIQTGDTGGDDFLIDGPELWITGLPQVANERTLWRYPIAGGPGDSMRIPDSVNRLATHESMDQLIVMLTELNKAVRVDKKNFVLDTSFRIPLQIFPLDIELSPDATVLYARNMLGTNNAVPLATAFDPGGPPSYMLEPAPLDEMAEYRQDVIDAFADLLPKFWQYLKDCFADQFLVDCPECGPEDRVYLGSVEIQQKQVYNICNFDKRHYVKSFPTYSHWLSVLPIHKIIKQVLKDFFCMVLP